MLDRKLYTSILSSSLILASSAAAEIVADQPGPPQFAQMCSNISLAVQGATENAVLKAYLSTPEGVVDLYPDGLAADSVDASSWNGTLACTGNEDLGYGFAALQVVDGSTTSNVVGMPVVGHPDLVPSVLALNGKFMADTSWDQYIAVANVETVLIPGTELVINGDGFDDPVVNVFTADGNCGPVAPESYTDNQITITLPASCITGPGSVQVVNQTNFATSNLISAPVGARTKVERVIVNQHHILVVGEGFSTKTVLNLFGRSLTTGEVENFGGLDDNSEPNVEIEIVDSTRFIFDLPADFQTGNGFVSAINPPFIPFTDSGKQNEKGAFNNL